MSKYRELGSFFDHLFRNDLNENFKEIAIDIQGMSENIKNLAAMGIDLSRFTFLDVINLNIHNLNTDIPGYYVNSIGALTPNAKWKASDYIPVIVGKTYTNTSVLQSAFYNEEKRFISMISFSGKSYTVPSGVSYVRHTYASNEAGVLCEGNTLINETANFGDRQVTVKDKGFKEMLVKVSNENLRIPRNSLTIEQMEYLNVINLNLHNIATDTKGYYISQAGAIVANTSYKVSDYIPIVSSATYSNSNSLSCAFFDVNKMYISGLPAGFTNPYTAPPNAMFVRHSYGVSETGVLCEGPVLIDPSASFGSQKITVTKTEFENMIKEIAGKTNTNTEGKSALIFGDSITQTDNIADDFSTHVVDWKTNWPTYTKKELKLGTTWNYGKDGSSYRERPGLVATQWITNQIKEAINKNRSADIIVVSAGTNDGPTDLGDFDVAMNKKKLEDLDKTKLYESLRWCFWTLRLNYPNATCYAGLPIQRTGGYSTTYVEPLLTAIKKMAREYNFIVIDAFSESGIVREFEVHQGAGRYLYDGLHPNETGKEKLAKIYTRVINSTYVG